MKRSSNSIVFTLLLSEGPFIATSQSPYQESELQAQISQQDRFNSTIQMHFQGLLKIFENEKGFE
jgi:hypothetical protein